MSFGAVKEIVGTVENGDRLIRVVVVRHDEGDYIRLESRRIEGGKWSPGRVLSLRPEEGPGVIAALSKAIEATTLEPGKRRKLNAVRRKLRAHDKAHGREDWKGRTRRDD